MSGQGVELRVLLLYIFPSFFSCSFTCEMGVSSGAVQKNMKIRWAIARTAPVFQKFSMCTRPPINKALMLIHFLFAFCSSTLEKMCFKSLYLESCDCWVIFYLFLVTSIYGLDKQRLKIGSVSSLQRKHLRGKKPPTN